MVEPPITFFNTAPQHGPRPLPLFLEMLRRETATSPERRVAALAGLRAYQDAPRGAKRRMARVRYRKGRARLRDYGAKHGTGRPVIFVPSLINPPFILDLQTDTSLLRWLASQGFRPLLLDWGSTSPDARAMDISAHVEQILLPLIAKLPEPPVLAGYCLGGTMAMAAASAVPVAGLAMIAAPWHFTGFGAAARADMAALWRAAQPLCETMGLVPMEVLQTGFWQLDPARTIAKYEAFAAMEPGSAAARSFVALEDWANEGQPLPYASGKQLFEEFIGGDLPGTGQWRIGRAVADPSRLTCPAINFVSLNDRIVPAASAADLGERRNLGAGHIGMVVGSGRHVQLWEPMLRWLRDLPHSR